MSFLSGQKVKYFCAFVAFKTTSENFRKQKIQNNRSLNYQIIFIVWSEHERTEKIYQKLVHLAKL